MKRVLITGGSGQLGHELLRLAPDTVQAWAPSSTELDIRDAESVASLVADWQPQLIINPAAYTAVDRAESEPEHAFAVNRDGAANLARTAQQLGIPLLHVSTDYVFDGSKQHPWQEDDPTGPQCVYGASKLAGEQAIAALCTQHFILRTSWVFGAHGNNFVKTMLRLGHERDELGVVADQRGGPTPAAAIAAVLWQVATHHLQGTPVHWGIYHFAGSPACSWHTFAEHIFAEAARIGLLSRIPNVKAIATSDYPTPASRPPNSVLDGSKLERELGIPPADWQQALRQMLQQMAIQ